MPENVMDLYPFRRITIEWCAEGEPVSAFNWPEWLDKVKSTHGPRLRFKISTEEALFAIRVEIAQGRISHEDVCFLYEDTLLFPDKGGRIGYWPRGFGDTIDYFLDTLVFPDSERNKKYDN